jgi:hypothetical protein
MSAKPDDEIVRLVTAPNPAEAHIWQQALQDEGIKAEVVGDFLDAGLGNIPGIKAELWVRKQDVDRATEILRRSQESKPADEEE